MAIEFEIQILSAQNLPSRGPFLLAPPNPFVEITAGGLSETTEPLKERTTEPFWDDAKFRFALEGTSEVKFEVKHQGKKERLLGSFASTVSQLLKQHCGQTHMAHQLTHPDGGTLTIAIEILSEVQTAELNSQIEASSISAGNAGGPSLSEGSSPSVPQWAAWEVNNDALGCINEWNLKHPGDKFYLKALSAFNKFMESELLQASMELIPDDPIPAKSLAKALINLALLGTKIPEKKREIYDFAFEVVKDIELLADAFGTKNQSLLKKAWDDLKETRDCVNDICKWANDKLESWSGSSSQKVEDWRKKLENAKCKFSQRTLIRILKAAGDMAPQLEELYQDHKVKEILDSVKKTLVNSVVLKAVYNAEGQKERDLYPETRQIILKEIDCWTNELPDTDVIKHDMTKHCIWFTGDPAVGKSSIAVAVAKTLNKQTLYGQFFVTRDIEVTTNPNKIFPTLALQLAERSPLAAVVIKEKLDSSSSKDIEELSEHQGRAIFFEALRVIAQYEEKKNNKVVIIIDGVDELDNTKIPHSETTSVLCQVMRDLPSNVKILVFSRPEDPIIDSIDSDIVIRRHVSPKESERDVEHFFRKELGKLAQDHRMANELLVKLCNLAEGLFGWANPAIAWIKKEVEQSSQKLVRLGEAVEELARLPPANVAALYNHILERVTPAESSMLNRKRFVQEFQVVIGCFVVLQEPQTISTIDALVSSDLTEGFTILDFFKNMSSFLEKTAMDNNTVPKAHKTVMDFLRSGSVMEPSLRLSLPEQHSRMTKACLRTFQNDLSFTIDNIKMSSKIDSDDEVQPISPHIAYSCKFFGQHLREADKSDELISDIDNFMKKHFLLWLKLLSLMKEPEFVLSTLNILETSVKDKNHNLSLFIQDAVKFVRKFEILIDTSPAHIDISFLPQAPSNSLIRKHYLPQLSRTLCVKGGPENWEDFWDKWNPKRVRSASLSRDGMLIAVTFPNNTLGIFTATTGEALCAPCTVNAWSVVFSHDGKLVALAGHAVLRLWEVKRSYLWGVTRVNEKKKFSVESIVQRSPLAFSCKGDCAVGCSNKIRIINSVTGEAPLSPLEGHSMDVRSLAYSPDGTQLVSCSANRASNNSVVRLWNTSDGTLISRIENSLSRMANSLSRHTDACFSPDGIQIALRSPDSIHLWTPKEAAKPCMLISGNGFSPPAFSPDGRFLVSFTDTKLLVLDLSSPQSNPKCIGHIATWPSSIAFFPDGKRVMTQCAEVIQVWDGNDPNIDWVTDDGTWIHLNGKCFFGRFPGFGVRLPNNTLIIGPHVDFSHFVHGKEWINHREPLALKSETGSHRDHLNIVTRLRAYCRRTSMWTFAACFLVFFAFLCYY